MREQGKGRIRARQATDGGRVVALERAQCPRGVAACAASAPAACAAAGASRAAPFPCRRRNVAGEALVLSQPASAATACTPSCVSRSSRAASAEPLVDQQAVHREPRGRAHLCLQPRRAQADALRELVDRPRRVPAPRRPARSRRTVASASSAPSRRPSARAQQLVQVEQHTGQQLGRARMEQRHEGRAGRRARRGCAREAVAHARRERRVAQHAAVVAVHEFGHLARRQLHAQRLQPARQQRRAAAGTARSCCCRRRGCGSGSRRRGLGVRSSARSTRSRARGPCALPIWPVTWPARKKATSSSSPGGSCTCRSSLRRKSKYSALAPSQRHGAQPQDATAVARPAHLAARAVVQARERERPLDRQPDQAALKSVLGQRA